MKVLFVLPKTEKFTGPMAAPLGALSICTYLNKHGHDARIFDRRTDPDFEGFLRGFKPGVIGISFISAMHFYDVKAITDISHRYDVTTVAGGAVASTMPEQMLKNRLCDIVSVGEGSCHGST